MFLYYIAFAMIVLLTIFFGALSLLSSPFDRRGNLQHLSSVYWGRLILKFTGVHVEVEGLENLSSFDRFILMSNHQSLYDIPILLSCVPLKFGFLAKESLFKIPLLGSHLSRTGSIPIDRSDSRDGVRSLLDGVKRIKKGGLGQRRPFPQRCNYFG